jgi:hypothetical protein
MSVKVAPLSEALAAPGPVAPVALSQRVEARHRHGSNDDARHQTSAPPAEHIPESGGDACHTAWGDRRAGLREQMTPEMALVVALPVVASNPALLPSVGVASEPVPNQPLAAPAAPARPVEGKPVAIAGTRAPRPPHAVATVAPANTAANSTPAVLGNATVPAAMSPLPLASAALPAAVTAPSAEHPPAPPSAPAIPALATAATSSTPPGAMRAVVERIQSALSVRGLPDPAAAPAPAPSPATPAGPAAPTLEPSLAVTGDVATPPPTALVVAAAPAAVDTPAQPQAGGESLLTAARAEANVTTRKIVHAAQQATVLQAAMAARTQPASQVNVAFRSWGVDASGSAHSVRVRLQDGQAIVQPSTARVGQALAAAELPFGVDLQTAVEQTSNATDERRRRRGQQPSP